MGSRSRSRSPRSASSSSSESKSEIIHFDWREGLVLNSKYELRQLLGDGTFGRVLLAHDQSSGGEVAIKIIRDSKSYVEDAKFEAAVLQQIRKEDPAGASRCAVIHETFTHAGKLFCLVLEPLGASLYDFLKGNKYQGYWMQDIQSFAQQSMQALSFLHGQLQMTHTDLKPENVLLESREPAVPTHFPRASGDRTLWKYLRPSSNRIKIIDFGNATHENDRHASLINTRQYRGPEVLLYLGWDHSSDLWSIGCILMELYVGDQLFETHEELEHLALINRVIGPFPQEMLEKMHQKVKDEWFVRNSASGRLQLPWPDRASSTSSEQHVAQQRPLRQQVLGRHASFADFIDGLLQMEPGRRSQAINALMHPFFSVKFDD